MFSVKYFVPRPGLEPGCFTAADFKSAGSDLNFPTEAYFIIYATNIQINIEINKFLMNFFIIWSRLVNHASLVYPSEAPHVR